MKKAEKSHSASAVIASIICFGLPGCGDSTAENSPAFGERANEVCRRLDQRLEEIRLPMIDWNLVASGRTPEAQRQREALAAYQDEARSALRDAFASLRSLETPSEQRERRDAWLDAFARRHKAAREVAAAVAELESAMQASDEAAASRAQRRFEANRAIEAEHKRRADRLAGELGADACVDL
jgi:hypothetical protein